MIQAVMPISSVPENLSLFAVGSVEPRVQSALSTVRDRTEVSRYVKKWLGEIERSGWNREGRLGRVLCGLLGVLITPLADAAAS